MITDESGYTSGFETTPAPETRAEGQAGPLMRRVTVDGADHLMPADAKLAEPYPTDGMEEEQQAWLEKNMDEPLGGTW